MVLSVATEKSPVTPPGIDPETVWLVAQFLNHYAIPGPKSNEYISEHINLENMQWLPTQIYVPNQEKNDTSLRL